MKTDTLKKFSLGLLAGALILGHPTRSEAAIITTGFESEEGFTPNGRNNTAGWTASANTRVRVSNGTTEPALEGSYSARLEGGASTVVFYNWAWADPKDKLDTYSFSFTNIGSTFTAQGSAAWVYIRLEDQGGPRIIQLYARYGDTAASPYRIQYNIDNGSGASTTAFKNVSKSDMVFEEWNTISAIFDFEAKTYTLTLNGLTIASDIKLPTSWNTTAIIGTQLVSPSNGVTYYDAVRAIPEPSTVQILGLSLLLLAGWKARLMIRRPLA